MRMIQKLKLFEQTVVFLRWATDAQFGKILYVGEDFIEFLALDPETMEYGDKMDKLFKSINEGEKRD